MTIYIKYKKKHIKTIRFEKRIRRINFKHTKTIDKMKIKRQNKIKNKNNKKKNNNNNKILSLSLLSFDKTRTNEKGNIS